MPQLRELFERHGKVAFPQHSTDHHPAGNGISSLIIHTDYHLPEILSRALQAGSAISKFQERRQALIYNIPNPKLTSRNMERLISLLIIAFMTIGSQAKDIVKTWPAPEGVALKKDFSVKVRIPGGKWQNVDTYSIAVADNRPIPRRVDATSVAKFDFEGRVEISVTSLTRDIDSVLVRPASLGIRLKPEADRRTVTFSIDRPRYLSIEINGDEMHNLQIFADRPIKMPKVRKRDLVYFGPGLHVLKDDSLGITSGKTVIIDGGAVIKGWLSVCNARDVRILGHGIVMPKRHTGIAVRYSKNVLVDGPLTTQLPVGGSDSVEVKNVKVMSSYGWGDGLNIFASNNVTQRNCFARTSDDCSTIYCTRLGYRGGCRNILIDGATYWANVAHPIMIGLHGDIDRNEKIENVTYKNIDILGQCEHQTDYMGCIGINNGDNILVKGIKFDSIRIENIQDGMLFNFRVCYNKKYCHAPGRGIEDVTLSNISYNGSRPTLSLIAGYDEDRRIKGISFKNLTINGRHIFDKMPGKPSYYKTSDMAGIFLGEHVEGVSFE